VKLFTLVVPSTCDARNFEKGLKRAVPGVSLSVITNMAEEITFNALPSAPEIEGKIYVVYETVGYIE